MSCRDRLVHIVARLALVGLVFGWAPAGAEVARPSGASVSRLDGVTLDGAPIDLAALRGQPVVLYAWGDWCRACERSTPALLDLARAHPTTAFIFINTDWPPRPLGEVYGPVPGNVRLARVDDGFFGAERLRRKRFDFPALGLVFGLPAYFLMDAAGRVVAQGNGSRYPAALAQRLAGADGMAVSAPVRP